MSNIIEETKQQLKYRLEKSYDCITRIAYIKTQLISLIDDIDIFKQYNLLNKLTEITNNVDCLT